MSRQRRLQLGVPDTLVILRLLAEQKKAMTPGEINEELGAELIGWTNHDVSAVLSHAKEHEFTSSQRTVRANISNIHEWSITEKGLRRVAAEVHIQPASVGLELAKGSVSEWLYRLKVPALYGAQVGAK